MKPSSYQHNEFFAHRPLSGVTFKHNDAVDIVGGDYAGNSGSIVGLDELGEDPCHLVELGSGQDVFISQSCLCLAEA
ncbi:hypothetical protein LJR143_002075 [Pseudoxanthomonas sp. LjRoot143]|uniref:hypothetical protein n=1 Tax=Pseudoxanthomonas sp. LjRoot143 TaxID=3342266 RepID=UPI003ECD8E68